MPDFADWDAYEAWLRDQPRDLVVAMATRSALRSTPFLFNESKTIDAELALKALRITLTSGVAAIALTTEVRRVAHSAVRSATSHANSFPYSIDLDALSAAISAGLSVTVSADSIDSTASYAARYSANYLDNELQSEISVDSEQSKQPRELFQVPLLRTHQARTANAATLRSASATDLAWSFWADWYEGFLSGKPLDWVLQRQIALIPDDEWEAGPGRIAELIEEIEARWEVRKRADDLRTDIKVSSRDRFGIGGNQPPESLEDDIFVNPAFEIVWAPLKVIEEEIEKDEPDRERVSAALAALKACVEWCGRKIDLTVDTAIKWGVPVAGASALGALNPEKVAALIYAVEKWLSFL